MHVTNNLCIEDIDFGQLNSINQAQAMTPNDERQCRCSITHSTDCLTLLLPRRLSLIVKTTHHSQTQSHSPEVSKNRHTNSHFPPESHIAFALRRRNLSIPNIIVNVQSFSGTESIKIL